MHLARDHHRSVVAGRVRDGSWLRVRPGAYVESRVLESADARRTLALARIVAIGAQLTSDTVLSHTSAALLWGLPTLRTPTVTHVVQPFSARSTASPDVVRRRRTLTAEDVVVLQGLRTTSLERTVVDCAMTEPVRGGVVVADAALHRGASRERCAQLLASLGPRRGVVRARLALETADDGAESAGESLARVALLEVGLPRPETQVPVETHLGTFWADLGWPEHRALAEYDGRGKYADRTGDVVVAEKRREDALLDGGWRLLRLTAEDLRRPAHLAARVRRALPDLTLTPRPSLST
ncbi:MULTISPECIES: hypothetical protein [unclassified Actinotalea]|uniref:hypothetical protein n=1 Tax=unclassified Actinotalea TaxID=2638618 RepID=UPI0015F4C268|nr:MULTISPECIES: hypothetical protein [unclassified Actinotalea]